MPSPDDQEPVKAVSADRTDPPFRVRVRLGARTGVRSTSVLSERNTSSKPRQNLMAASTGSL